MRIGSLSCAVGFMCTGLLRAAAGTSKSAVGSDGTLWGTSGYSQKCTAHGRLAVEMSICTLDSNVTLLILASEYPDSSDKRHSQF